MCGYVTRRIAIIQLATLALLALSILKLPIFPENALAHSGAWLWPATPSVGAQNDDVVVLLFSSLPGGIARGQSLRVSVANFIRLDGRDQNPVEVRAQVNLVDSRGRIIAQSAEASIAKNQFRSFDFNRDRLPLPGEPRTGRLQVMEELTVRCVGVNRNEAQTIRQKVLEFLPASSELTENPTGESQATNRCLPFSIWSQAQSPSTPNSLGLPYGHTLRFSALNPDEAGRPGEPIRVRIRLTDAGGTIIAQSAEVTIQAGQFHSFDFNRIAIPLPGEPGTGRLQVAWSVEASTQGPSPLPLAISVEVVENTTGLSSTSKVAYGYLSMPSS